jgi:hypothetical protein
MKFYIAIVILSFALETFTLQCANFTCGDFTTEGACAIKTFTETGLQIKLHSCAVEKICPFQAALDEEDICAEPFNLLPGELCLKAEQCLSKNCDGTKCIGKSANDVCGSDAECGVGLYCLNQKCNATLHIGDACSDTKKCQVNSVCSNSICVQLASLENDASATVPAACKSFYIENDKCTSGPMLDGLTSGQPAMACPETKTCTYKRVKGDPLTEGCTCGMQDSIAQVCRPGEGDISMTEVSNILFPFSSLLMLDLLN